MEFEEIKYIDVWKEENLKNNFFCKWKVNLISTREVGGGGEGDSAPPCYTFINKFLFTSAFFMKFSDFF